MIRVISKAVCVALAWLRSAESRLRRWLTGRSLRLLLPVVLILALVFVLAGMLAKVVRPILDSAFGGMDRESVLMGLGIAAGVAALLFYLAHVIGKWLKPGITTLHENLLHLVTLRLSPDLRAEAEATVAEIMAVAKAWGQAQKLRGFGMVFTWVATFTLAIAGVLYAVAQIAKMQAQNQLLDSQNRIVIIEQQFQQEKDLANQRYEEIRDILLNLDSTPTAQAYALSLIPDAMRMPVTQAREKEPTDGKLKAEKQNDGEQSGSKVTDIPSYPNAGRLRSLLQTYMKLDRVGHALAKARAAGEFSPGASPGSAEVLSVLRPLEPASTALFVTLHRLGPSRSPDGSIVSGKGCLWDYAANAAQGDDGLSPPPCAAEIGSQQLKSGDEHRVKFIHLEHVGSTADAMSSNPFQGAQAPFAFVGSKDPPVVVFGWDTDLGRSHLEGAFLMFAFLVGTDLSNAHLDGAALSGASLEGANLSSATMEGANLSSASLEGTDLRGAQLQGANLSTANLEGAILRATSLEGTDLRDAQLEGANFASAHLEGADLRGANLQGVKLLEEAHLYGADLGGAQLQGVDLSTARLAGVNLMGAHLQGANLEWAQFATSEVRVVIKAVTDWTGETSSVVSVSDGLNEVSGDICDLELSSALMAKTNVKGEFHCLAACRT